MCFQKSQKSVRTCDANATRIYHREGSKNKGEKTSLHHRFKEKKNHSHCTSCLRLWHCDLSYSSSEQQEVFFLHPPILLVCLSGILTTLLHIFEPNRICSNQNGHNQQEKTVIIPVMYVCMELINYIHGHYHNVGVRCFTTLPSWTSGQLVTELLTPTPSLTKGTSMYSCAYHNVCVKPRKR